MIQILSTAGALGLSPEELAALELARARANWTVVAIIVVGLGALWLTAPRRGR